jgi:hypothetical protein
MSDISTIPAINGKTTVGAPIEKAFRVFTSSFGTWWPREFHIGQAENPIDQLAEAFTAVAMTTSPLKTYLSSP